MVLKFIAEILLKKIVEKPFEKLIDLAEGFEQKKSAYYILSAIISLSSMLFSIIFFSKTTYFFVSLACSFTMFVLLVAEAIKFDNDFRKSLKLLN